MGNGFIYTQILRKDNFYMSIALNQHNILKIHAL